MTVTKKSFTISKVQAVYLNFKFPDKPYISEGPTYFTSITMTENAGFCDGTELDILTGKAFVVDISCILSFTYSLMIFHVTIQHQNRVASHCRAFVGYTME